MMTIEVILPGLLTTVQDRGRAGYRNSGVPIGGAMDAVSMRIANMLVGNDEAEALLEMTLTGPTLRFDGEAVIAICGADLAPEIAGIPVPMWRPVVVPSQGVLEFRRVRRGCRSYLALAGGFDVPGVLGSRGAFLSAGIEGVHGETVAAGDLLRQREPGNADNPATTPGWYVDGGSLISLGVEPVVRVLRGPEFERFTAVSRDQLLSECCTVTAESNRMGYRLAGPALETDAPLEMLTEGVAPGTIQVPPDGAPIILMADCQTTGGYPRIAHVISADLPIVAQLKPGDSLRFEEITLHEAQRLFIERERTLRDLKRAIALRWKFG